MGASGHPQLKARGVQGSGECLRQEPQRRFRRRCGRRTLPSGIRGSESRHLLPHPAQALLRQVLDGRDHQLVAGPEVVQLRATRQAGPLCDRSAGRPRIAELGQTRHRGIQQRPSRGRRTLLLSSHWHRHSDQSTCVHERMYCRAVRWDKCSRRFAVDGAGPPTAKPADAIARQTGTIRRGGSWVWGLVPLRTPRRPPPVDVSLGRSAGSLCRNHRRHRLPLLCPADLGRGKERWGCFGQPRPGSCPVSPRRNR